MSVISLEHLKSVLKSLSSTIFKNIEKVNSAAEQAQATADDAVKTHENKMDKVNPSGTGYIVMNPLMGREYGKNSSSFGRGSATAENAHAEGFATASGFESHAEGDASYAKGIASHAEGTGTEATSNSAHSEGGYTKATHWYAHAEGNNTQATAIAAHAEGISTQANSKGAHAEGLHTRAYVNNPGTHAQGRANIPDADGKYAHIVGNGKITNLDNTGDTSVETYSNAHTVDWGGNAWYAGNVYVGGTGQDDENASKLISEKQVGKGLKMDGDALTVDEGEYELIEKIIIGYELLTAKPDDWDTNWTAYYRNTGTAKEPVYELLTDATAPTWASNTFYAYTGEGASVKRYYPDDENYRFDVVDIRLTSTTNGASVNNGFSYCRHNTETAAQWWLNRNSNTAAKKLVARVRVEKHNGLWVLKMNQWTESTMSAQQVYVAYIPSYEKSTKKYPFINHIDIRDTISAGTTIEIWGVRHNAKNQ